MQVGFIHFVHFIHLGLLFVHFVLNLGLISDW